MALVRLTRHQIDALLIASHSADTRYLSWRVRVAIQNALDEARQRVPITDPAPEPYPDADIVVGRGVVTCTACRNSYMIGALVSPDGTVPAWVCDHVAHWHSLGRAGCLP